MPRAKKEVAKSDALHPELVLLEELIAEQTLLAEKRADEAINKINVTYIAKGDHIAFLVCKSGGQLPRRRLYLCRVLDVKDTPNENDLDGTHPDHKRHR